MPSARDALAAAGAALAAAGVPTPGLDAELLLAHLTGQPRLMLRLGPDLDSDQAHAYAGLVARRAAREPLQHIVGTAAFRHLELGVGPGTFVPRPETELLVDEALAALAGRPGRPTVVDLCTGSGALALAIATERPGTDVVAVELSEAALGQARANAAALTDALERVGSTVDVVAGDATVVAAPDAPLARLRGRVDVVVSNPPYIPDGMVPRDPEVREHDPHAALFGGPDGLAVVRPLVAQAALLLRPGGLLVVEHADVQGEQAGAAGVPGVLRAHLVPGSQGAEPAWQDVADHLDLAQRPRYTTARRAGTMVR